MSLSLGNHVDRYIERYLLESFEKIDDGRGEHLPSEVEEYLERAWGADLAEMWRGWWLESGEDYV